MRSEWLGSLLAKGFYIKASFPYLWIIDATLCHIVRWKDQLVEGQTWIEIGLKRILKDRIFVPLSFRTTCECKQTNPSSILKRKNPISKIWPSTDYIIKQSIDSLYVHLLQKEFKAASNMMHSMRLIIELFGFQHVSQRENFIIKSLPSASASWLKNHCHWNKNWQSTQD